MDLLAYIKHRKIIVPQVEKELLVTFGSSPSASSLYKIAAGTMQMGIEVALMLSHWSNREITLEECILEKKHTPPLRRIDSYELIGSPERRKLLLKALAGNELDDMLGETQQNNVTTDVVEEEL